MPNIHVHCYFHINILVVILVFISKHACIFLWSILSFMFINVCLCNLHWPPGRGIIHGRGQQSARQPGTVHRHIQGSTRLLHKVCVTWSLITPMWHVTWSSSPSPVHAMCWPVSGVTWSLATPMWHVTWSWSCSPSPVHAMCWSVSGVTWSLVTPMWHVTWSSSPSPVHAMCWPVSVADSQWPLTNTDDRARWRDTSSPLLHVPHSTTCIAPPVPMLTVISWSYHLAWWFNLCSDPNPFSSDVIVYDSPAY